MSCLNCSDCSEHLQFNFKCFILTKLTFVLELFTYLRPDECHAHDDFASSKVSVARKCVLKHGIDKATVLVGCCSWASIYRTYTIPSQISIDVSSSANVW